MNHILSVGIDPGIFGAVTVLLDRTILRTYLMPKNKDKKFCVRSFQQNVLSDIKSSFDTDYMRVILEKSQPMPKQGVSSMFSYGEHFGMIQASLVALNMEYELIRPRDWHKRLQSLYYHQDDLSAKENALNAWRHILEPYNPPDVLLPTKRMRKPHEGIIDSSLIALVGVL